MSTKTAITQQTFDGLAFPVVRVRYAGPTNSRGSRWIATLRRDNERSYRAVESYSYELSQGAPNALPAALACVEKMQADTGWSEEYVAIPGDLEADTYSFTFVPAYILNA